MIGGPAALHRCEQLATEQGLRVSWRKRDLFDDWAVGYYPAQCTLETHFYAEHTGETLVEAAEATARALLARANRAAGRRERGRQLPGDGAVPPQRPRR